MTDTTHTCLHNNDSVTVPLVAPGEGSQYIGCWQLEGTDPERGERLSIGNRCVFFFSVLVCFYFRERVRVFLFGFMVAFFCKTHSG